MCVHIQKNIALKIDSNLVERVHRYDLASPRFLECTPEIAIMHGFDNLPQTQKNSEWTERDFLNVLREYHNLPTSSSSYYWYNLCTS